MAKVWNTKRLLKAMNDSGYKRDFIEKKIGYARGSLMNVLAGTRHPSMSQLVKLAAIFQTSPEYLDNQTDDPTPHSEIEAKNGK